MLLLVLGALAVAGERLAPEISRDVGEADGVVVLWPRVSPDGKRAVAQAAGWQVQRALVDIVGRAAPERTLSVRPQPERVCPRQGCVAPRVGALVVRHKQGCAVVATLGEPGVSPLRVVPWVGTVQLRATEVPFREPPESWVGVGDFVPCDRLATPLSEGEAAVREALTALLTPS